MHVKDVEQSTTDKRGVWNSIDTIFTYGQSEMGVLRGTNLGILITPRVTAFSCDSRPLDAALLAIVYLSSNYSVKSTDLPVYATRFRYVLQIPGLSESSLCGWSLARCFRHLSVIILAFDTTRK